MFIPMEPKTNPFRFGGDLSSKDLVDRVEETTQVEAAVRNGGKLFLIGPRRFGKSSILRAAEEKLTASGAVVLRLNAETYPTLDMLVEQIVTETATRLKGKVDFVIDQLRRYFSHLRPEINFNVTEHKFSATIGVRAVSETHEAVTLLSKALQGLEDLAAALPDDRPVGLILDEFQSVIERGGSTAEAQIRSVIQEHSRVGYVFAGSQTRIMTDMTMRPERPFYRLGDNRFVGPLPRKEFADHLAKQFRKSGFRLGNSEPIETILNLSEEVPYNVQWLAHNCWEQLRSARGHQHPALTTAVVISVLEQTVRSLDPLFTQTWNQRTPVQQKTLLAVIRENGSGLTSSPVVKTIGAAPSTVQSALSALKDHSILRDEPAQGSVRISFEDPFFAQWIRLTIMSR